MIEPLRGDKVTEEKLSSDLSTIPRREKLRARAGYLECPVIGASTSIGEARQRFISALLPRLISISQSCASSRTKFTYETGYLPAPFMHHG